MFFHDKILSLSNCPIPTQKLYISDTSDNASAQTNSSIFSTHLQTIWPKYDEAYGEKSCVENAMKNIKDSLN